MKNLNLLIVEGNVKEDTEIFIKAAGTSASENLKKLLLKLEPSAIIVIVHPGNEKEVKSLMEKHGTYKVEIENYTSFIFPLQYDPQLVKYYNNNQRYLQRKLPDKVFKTTRIFEKEEIRWIKADDLKKMRHKFRHFYRFMVDLLYNEQKQIKSFIQKGVNKKTRFTRRKRKSVVKNKKSRKNK